MKKALILALPLVALSLASCSDNDDAPVIKPTVAVTAGEADQTTLTFTITPENAEKCAWVCLEAGEEVPTAEEILANDANEASATEPTTVEVTDLTPDTEYLIVAAVSNNDGKNTAVSEHVLIKTKEIVYNVITFSDCEFPAGKNTNVVSGGGSYTDFNCVFQFAEKYTMVGGCVVSDVHEINDNSSSSPKAYGVALTAEGDEANKFLYVQKYSYLSVPEAAPAFAFADGEERVISSIDVMNSTEMYQYITIGWYSYTPMVAGDWCLLTLTGYNAAGEVTGTVEQYLADFRNGESMVVDAWTTVSTEALGKVNKVEVAVTWADTWEKSSPSNFSVCLDNIKMPEVTE